MNNAITPPTAEDLATAKQVAEWMETLSETEQPSDYLHSISIYGRVGVVNLKGCGIVASAIQAFNRELARKAERTRVVSKHVGKIGDRLQVKAKLVARFDSQGHFGATFIHKFVLVDGPDAGADLTWFGSSQIGNIGDTLWIKATIKAHDEYKGVKQTIISRTTECQDPDSEKAEKAALAKTKRDAKKAQTAARKAFGTPKVVAEYVDQFGADGVEKATTVRFVQVAANEVCYEDRSIGTELWTRGESYETLEDAAQRCEWRLRFMKKV